MPKVMVASWNGPPGSLMRIEKVIRQGSHGGSTYRIFGPRGNYLEMSKTNILQMVDMLDDACDAIDEGEF